MIDLAFYTGGADEVRARRGVPPQRPDAPLRADRPRPPRAGAPLGPPPALGRDARLLATTAARIREHLLTDVVPFDDAPDLFAELSARRRHVLTAVLTVDGP